jgi:hypothetical protein
MRGFGLLLAAVLVVFGLAACGDDDDDDDDIADEVEDEVEDQEAEGDDDDGEDVDGSAVGASLTEFQIVVDPASVPAGEITFSVSNDGGTEHEFEIFRTDLGADGLPTNEDGSVDSDGEDLEEIDEIEEFEPGTTETLTTELEAGSYVFICNVVQDELSHYAEGMRVAFVIE